jgi:hypothetical protein
MTDPAFNSDNEDSPRTNKTEKRPWDGNVVSVGAKNQSAFYVRMVKRLLSAGVHDKIELQGRGEMGIMRVTQVQNTLCRYGYCKLERLMTGPYPALVVVLSKAEGFDEQNEAFNRQLEERAAERLEQQQKAQEAKDAEEAEAKDDEDAEVKEWKEGAQKASENVNATAE